MIIENYLRDVQAERDVAALVSGPRNDICAAGGNLVSDTHQKWRSISWYCDPMDRVPTVRVYFRPDDGDRYIVTDLGEAVRALRLRTGVLDVEHPAQEVIAGVKWADEHDRPAGITMGPGDALRTFNACVYGTEMDTVAAGALPRAIVGVMFAAWRVATMELA